MRRLAIFGVCTWVAGLAMIAYAANAGNGSGHGGGGGGGGGGGSRAITAHGTSQPTGGTSGPNRSSGSKQQFLKFTFKQVAVKTVSWSHDSSRKAPRKAPVTSNTGSKIAQ
jgi:hypothetical protein